MVDRILLVLDVIVGTVATFAFTYWWTRFCLRAYRRQRR